LIGGAAAGAFVLGVAIMILSRKKK
jgi:hypothetical protein